MRPVWTSILTIVTCAVPATLFAGLPRQAPQEGAQRRPLDQRQLEEVGRMSADDSQAFIVQFFQRSVAGRSIGTKKSQAYPRQRLADAIGQYRDGLDEFKVAIGLPPHALLIPDPEAIAPFRAASDRAHNWHRGPNRTLEVLPKFSAGFLPWVR